MRLSWRLTGSMVTYLPWALVLILPIAVNLIVWNAVVRPERLNLKTWRDTRSLTQIRPELETLLGQSGQMIAQWENSIYKKDDPSAAMQMIQRLATENRVQVKGIQTKLYEETPSSARKGNNALGLTEMPVDIAVVGSYAKLAKWLSDLEAQRSLQINSWTLQPSTDADRLLHLTLRVTVLLRGA